MGRKPKLSVEQKINICEQYLNGKKSLRKLADDVGVSDVAVRKWILKYTSDCNRVLFSILSHPFFFLSS